MVNIDLGDYVRYNFYDYIFGRSKNYIEQNIEKIENKILWECNHFNYITNVF